ncbi:hypothetical protein QR680_003917 [Steinernema hermaphroditum]|uniref:Uncharacterized protein n=1 Tax=Steinernema hermaphroditum TaxID=289476 RepID=A0AA39LSU2_9BILA|nr:hypothetical protein QR680_003917 [Steinernema hermaphroditum]
MDEMDDGLRIAACQAFNMRLLNLHHWSAERQLFKMNPEWYIPYHPTPRTLTKQDRLGFRIRHMRRLDYEEFALAFLPFLPVTTTTVRLRVNHVTGTS